MAREAWNPGGNGSKIRHMENVFTSRDNTVFAIDGANYLINGEPMTLGEFKRILFRKVTLSDAANPDSVDQDRLFAFVFRNESAQRDTRQNRWERVPKWRRALILLLERLQRRLTPDWL